MKREQRILPLVPVILFILSYTVPCLAGEVITDSARKWAKDAVKQEKSITAAPSGNTVAVLNFRNASSYPSLEPLQKGFAFMLMTDLAAVPGIQLIERTRLQALVEELKMGASGIVEKDTAPRVGRLLRASYLVGGELSSKDQKDIQIGSFLWGVSGNRLIGTPEAKGNLESIFDLEKQILFSIIDQLKISLTKDQRSRLAKPFTTNLRALYYLSRGLESSDRGNYLQAQIYYSRAVSADPQLGAASSASRELIQKRLSPAKPKEAAVVRQMEAQNSSTASLLQNNSTYRALNPYQIEQGHGSGQVKVSW